MKKIKITTPENIEVEYTLADVGSRTAAAVIDFLIQGMFILLILIAMFIIYYFSPDFWEKYYGWIAGISLLLYGLITYGYFIVMELSGNGQTIGKKALKLRTIRNNGQSITLKHSAIRNLFKVFIDILGIGLIVIFFTREHKRLGDYAASTLVISEGSEKAPVSLDELQNANKNFSYYLSAEEQELLRDYFKRKNEMDNNEGIREKLRLYFNEKFEAQGEFNEWKEFIDKI
ncbi:RDD family protein [Candidatus Clostridium stratigraminis]|uniref:RDD family protein n=1 Tax=Candidatus Clostridium stratigraminis TaxID=3381661 RepID=A0ABW8T7H1_9CLOT